MESAMAELCGGADWYRLLWRDFELQVINIGTLTDLCVTTVTVAP